MMMTLYCTDVSRVVEYNQCYRMRLGNHKEENKHNTYKVLKTTEDGNAPEATTIACNAVSCNGKGKRRFKGSLIFRDFIKK